MVYKNEQDIDGGVWAWLTLCGCVLSGLFTGTITYSPGIFNVALLRIYHEDVTTTSLVGAICSGMLYLTGPLASIIVQKTSCRFTHCLGGLLVFIGFSASHFANNLTHLFVTYSLIAGLGTGLCSTSFAIVPVYRFKKHLGAVVGIQMLGGGLSLVIGGLFVQNVLDTYGLHGAYLIMGAYGSHLIMCGLLMKPSTLEIKTNQNKAARIHEKTEQTSNRRNNYTSIKSFVKESFIITLLKDPCFLLIYVSSFLWHIPVAAFQVHLPNYAVTNGATPVEASALFTVCGVASIIGRSLTGILIGPIRLKPLTVEICALGIIGIATSCLSLYSQTYIGQALYAGIYGIVVGALTTLFSPICFDFSKMADVASSIGLRCFIGGIAYIIGPTVVGLIIDMGGSYEDGFYLCGGLFVFATVIDLVALCIFTNRHRSPTAIGNEIVESLVSLKPGPDVESKKDASADPLTKRFGNSA